MFVRYWVTIRKYDYYCYYEDPNDQRVIPFPHCSNRLTKHRSSWSVINCHGFFLVFRKNMLKCELSLRKPLKLPLFCKCIIIYIVFINKCWKIIGFKFHFLSFFYFSLKTKRSERIRYNCEHLLQFQALFARHHALLWSWSICDPWISLFC